MRVLAVLPGNDFCSVFEHVGWMLAICMEEGANAAGSEGSGNQDVQVHQPRCSHLMSPFSFFTNQSPDLSRVDLPSQRVQLSPSSVPLMIRS